ncbi:MAG: hypothetical protein AAB320_03475 [Elusimicrobiota bacterium]
MSLISAALTVLLSAPLAAQPPASLTLRGSVPAHQTEARLGAWLDAQPLVARKIAQISSEARLLADAMAPESDLRDAMSDRPAPQDGPQSVAALPGMTAKPQAGCVALSDCANPPLALDVEDAAALRPALRRLLRPWLLLQQAGQDKIKIDAVAGEDARLLELSWAGTALKKVALNVSPKPEGGFRLWLDRPFELAEHYNAGRDAALRR